MKHVADLAERITAAVAGVIKGKDEPIRMAVIAMLCEGHLLIEDVPGTGKTTLARALAATFDGSFSRLQFTADLLPADVTGTSVFDARTSDFTFRPGPVFANVLLADEINRAAPKTQAALLEAMAERQVSNDGESLQLPRPFLVLATQNPSDTDGTYPLPNAQLDRFCLRLSMGYPAPADELDVLAGRRSALEDVPAVLDVPTLRTAIATVRTVRASDELCSYVVALANATRTHPDLARGASTRAALTLLDTSRARAACLGRDFVLPEDIKAMAPAVLTHRLVLSSDAHLRGASLTKVLSDLLTRVEIPTRSMRIAG
ncbi:MAG: AAA family ATPase [Actinomycetales bacterium]